MGIYRLVLSLFAFASDVLYRFVHHLHESVASYWAPSPLLPCWRKGQRGGGVCSRVLSRFFYKKNMYWCPVISYEETAAHATFVHHFEAIVFFRNVDYDYRSWWGDRVRRQPYQPGFPYPFFAIFPTIIRLFLSDPYVFLRALTPERGRHPV